jgi:hypothetical protein
VAAGTVTVRVPDVPDSEARSAPCCRRFSVHVVPAVADGGASKVTTVLLRRGPAWMAANAVEVMTRDAAEASAAPTRTLDANVRRGRGR